MKTFTTILLLSLLTTKTLQTACKSLKTVEKELNIQFPGIFSKKSLSKFAKEARELGNKETFAFYELNTTPKLYLRKASKTSDLQKSIELNQKLTTAFGTDYKPFTYYLNCIDTGRTLIHIFKNFGNGRLSKIWFYNAFTENTTQRHRLLTLKDDLTLIKKMKDLGIIAKGLTYHDSEMLPIKNSEYLYRPNNYLLDNLSDGPISYKKTKYDIFLSPEERLNSTVEAQSMIYNLILTYIVFEAKEQLDVLEKNESQKLLDFVMGNGDVENARGLVEMLKPFFEGREGKKLWKSLIEMGLRFEKSERMSVEKGLEVCEELLAKFPAPVVLKKKIVLV